MRPITNPSQLSDKTMVGDSLDTHKYLTMKYNISANESASSSLRRTFMAIHRDEIDAAEKLFDIMNRQGWYPVQSASPQQVSQVESRYPSI